MPGFGQNHATVGVLRHHGEMERPGVAAEVQRAVLDDRRELHQVQISGENAPRFLRKQGQEFFHFFEFALRRRAGQRQFFFGKFFREGGDQFRQLLRRQFLGIRRGERAEVKISSLVRLGNFRRAQIRRVNLRVKFRLREREARLLPGSGSVASKPAPR